jgi:hypothetical protein
MLRHHHVPAYEEVVVHPHCFQRTLEKVPRRSRPKMLLASVTTERDEMEIPGILIANQRFGHGYILIPHLKGEMWGTQIQTRATRRLLAQGSRFGD